MRKIYFVRMSLVPEKSGLIERRLSLMDSLVVTKGVTKDSRGEFDDIALDSVVEFGGIRRESGESNQDLVIPT
jgi:hypothetical protein